MKLDISKVDLTNQNQKIFAGILLAIVIAILYYTLPSIVWFLKNIWIAIILLIPLIFLIFNHQMVWQVFKQLSWNLTKALISGDKLGYMYRYHEYLLTKINALGGNVTNIGAIEVKLDRKSKELAKVISDNKKQAVLYEQKGSPQTVLRTIANKVNVDTKQLEALLPKLEVVRKQKKYLIDLYDNWVADAEDLKYTLDAKADEYKTLKELNEATGNAKEFLKGNSEEYKIYQESLNQIEQSVTQYTANLEDFERKAKPILDNMSMGRTVSEDEGLQLIEEFKKNSISLKID